MRARYTPKDRPAVAVAVDVESFAVGHLTSPFTDPKFALARLIDLLAEREVLSGGHVLHVLGFTDGQLELDDGQPRTDAEWADYWAARDAALAQERELGFQRRVEARLARERGEVEQERAEIDARVALTEDSAAYGKIWKAIDAYADLRGLQRGQWSEQLDSMKTVVDRAIQADRDTRARRAVEAARGEPREPGVGKRPDRDGWYWAQPAGGGEWQPVRVMLHRNVADDGFTGEIVLDRFVVLACDEYSELSDWTWGPRIDPPGSAS